MLFKLVIWLDGLSIKSDQATINCKPAVATASMFLITTSHALPKLGEGKIGM